jgi:glycosyltransferase involved in cell wall biosynthesis
MKIALYSPSWPPGNAPNGIVTYCDVMVSALRDLGHEVYVVCGQLNGDDNSPYVIPIDKKINHIHRKFINLWERCIPGYAGYKIGALAIKQAFFNLHQRENLDVIELEESFAWCGFLAKSLPIPVIVRLHGPHFLNGVIGKTKGLSKADNYRLKKEGEALNCVNYITSPCQNTYDLTKEKYNIHPIKSQVIHNPAGKILKKWQYSACNKDELLFIGRFDSHKGADLVLDGFALLAMDNPKISLVFVGPDKGIYDSAGECIYFQEYIQKYASTVVDRIIYLGKLPHADIEALRLKAAVTIMPSRFEVFPYTVLEAMAYGCPLVTTNVGGIPEIAIDKKNALVVEPTSQDIANAIQVLYNNPGYAADLGLKASETILAQFQGDFIAKQTVNFYGGVIHDFVKHNR